MSRRRWSFSLGPLQFTRSREFFCLSFSLAWTTDKCHVCFDLKSRLSCLVLLRYLIFSPLFLFSFDLELHLSCDAIPLVFLFILTLKPVHIQPCDLDAGTLNISLDAKPLVP
jgi:hypothetical protein